MRVLFWSGTFWPKIGGVEVLAAKLLPVLKERGFEIVVVTPRNDPELPAEEQYHGIRVYRLPFFSAGQNIQHLITLRQKVIDIKRALAPQLIHINAVGLSDFFHLTTANAYPAPLLVTLHDEKLHDDIVDPEVGDDRLLGRTLRSADWVSCVSESLLAEVRRLIPELRPRSSVVHNGLEIPDLAPLPLPQNPPRLLCLGRLVRRKGFDLALAAFAIIARRFLRARLVIAGDGPERAALERQAVALDIKDRIEFVGWLEPSMVSELLNTATIVVMPSRREPFGLVALEAALMARPIVATRVGGIAEIVEHGKTGLLVENEHASGLAEAISRLLEHPEIAVDMGRAARQRTINKFGWKRCVDGYEALYRKLGQASHFPGEATF
ncbi:MAG: glycosyltransferase family 4 protein [Candidatus Binatia bacterium]